MTKKLNYIFDLFGTLIEHPEPDYNFLFPGKDSNIILKDLLTVNFDNFDNSADYSEKFNRCFEYLETHHGLDPTRRKVLFDYIEDWKVCSRLSENTEIVLEQLKARGNRIALISNSYVTIEDMLERFGLMDYFDVMIFSHIVNIAKPDARIYEQCLAELACRPEDAVMIGNDLENDVLMPRSLGIKGILYDPHVKYPDFKPRISNLGQILDYKSIIPIPR